MFEDKYSIAIFVEDVRDGSKIVSKTYEMYPHSFEVVKQLLELIETLEGSEG